MRSARYEDARAQVGVYITNAENAEGIAPYETVRAQIANEFQRLVLAEVVEQRHPDRKTAIVNGALVIVPKDFQRGVDY